MINIDLAVEAAKHTFEVVVKEDEEDGTRAGFVVVGAMSEQYGKARREMEVAGIRMARNRKGKVDWKGAEGDEVIADQRTEANMIVAKNCTIGWFGFYVGKDEPVEFEFNRENLEKVLGLFPVFADRISLEVQNDENFIRK